MPDIHQAKLCTGYNHLLFSMGCVWQVSRAALALFEYGQQVAESRGLLLVDTKYEFGTTKEGEIVLVDEIHTPDSSRCKGLTSCTKNGTYVGQGKRLQTAFLHETASTLYSLPGR